MARKTMQNIHRETQKVVHSSMLHQHTKCPELNTWRGFNYSGCKLQTSAPISRMSSAAQREHCNEPKEKMLQT